MKGIVLLLLYTFYFMFDPLFCLFLSRLFMASSGYIWPLAINGIRLMETSSNLGKVISAIAALDVLIFDAFDIPSTYSHGKVISSIFNYILNDKLDEKFNKYIYQTFRLFSAQKQRFEIDLGRLDRYNEKDDGKLVNLIVNELQVFSEYDDYVGCDKYEEYKVNIENINIITPQLFDVFKNINHVYIKADYHVRGNVDVDKHYIFSLLKLLSVIEGTTVHTVEIEAEWIEKLWESSAEIFVEAYAKKRFIITMDDTLTIKRS